MEETVLITKGEFEKFKRFYVYLKPLVIEKLKEKSMIEVGKEYPQKDEDVTDFEYCIEDNCFVIRTEYHGKYGCNDKEYYSLSPEFLYDNNAMSNFKEEIAKKKQKEQLEKDIKEQNEKQKTEDSEMIKLAELAKKYNFEVIPK